MAFDLAAGLGFVGGIVDTLFGKDQAKQNLQLQEDMFETSVQTRVRDANKAGIHPLYALGHQGPSFSPVVVGSDLASAGQNLGRAMDSVRDDGEKSGAFDTTVKQLTLQKMGLENDLLASQLRIVNQPGQPPTQSGMRSMPGQGSTPAVFTTGDNATITVSPNNTPAQDWENQYGEIAGELGGIGNLAVDGVRTVRKALQGTDETGIEFLKRQLLPYLQAGPKPKKKTTGNRY